MVRSRRSFLFLAVILGGQLVGPAFALEDG
jgi:hypothetical protein